MLYVYKICEDTIYDELGHPYAVYGIQVVNSAGRVLAAYPDVYFDRAQAERLVDRCNQNDLAPVHLHDVVMDAIQEDAMV